MSKPDALKKAAVFSALLALALLSLTFSGTLTDAGVSDKLRHFAAYGALSYFGLYAFPGKVELRWVFGLVLYGIGLEVVQLWVPGRTFSLGDIFANTLGVLFGYALMGLTRRMCRQVSR